MKKVNYEYPVGDFLSGFSEDENNPCDYELECQRMVKRGVQYLDENENLFHLIAVQNLQMGDKELKPMIDFMCQNPDKPEQNYGQTGGMVGHTLTHAYHAKKLGWDQYIEIITDKSEEHE